MSEIAAPVHSPAGAADRPNAASLAAQARHERIALLLMILPALLTIAAICLAPMVWMFGLSLIGPNGPTLVNYERLLHPAYLLSFKTTFELAFVVSGLCILFGYPLAYLITLLPRRLASIALLCVLIPFTTSLLVRVYGWLVLLQRHGVVNTWLVQLGLAGEPQSLVNNFTGTVIGMTQIMLPYMVFPLYASISAIDPDLPRAAGSLGASPFQRFWQILVPLTLPGLVAGVVAVFVLCLGFYVTPVLLGGGRVMTWSMQIDRNVTLYPDWGAASSLGVVLLVATLGSFWAVSRLFRLDQAFKVN